MTNLDIAFDRPWYLLLLVLVPMLWLFSYRTLAGLGSLRRGLAIAFRTLVLLLVILALAEIQFRRTSDRLTVIYLLDQSESIPAAKRQLMLDYTVQEVATHRNANRGDRAGVVVFAHDAQIEVPPFDDDLPAADAVESYLERKDATNLEAAVKLAVASFPEDSAKRIVLITDGNENVGNVRSLAPMLAEQKIGVDVVPITLTRRAETAVDKIALPPDIRLGQPIEARVVVSNFSDSQGAEEGVRVPGRLKITRRIGRQEELLSEQPVVLEPGKNVYRFEHEIEQPSVYTYRAAFTPDDPQNDLMPQNNQATAFTHVRGRGRVLLIEDWQNAGDFDYLVERLRANDIEVTVQGSDQLYTSLAELQAYDSVILANVPRSSGEDAKTVTNFTDEQIEMLVRNTEQFGCGLLMLGGENSFGAGGWANTELEKAMPVDFQIKNAKVQAVGALALLMHASELAQGNHWQKVVAAEAIKTLGPMDYCGLLHWDNMTARDAWLWRAGNRGLVRVTGQRRMMLARLERMAPGDMPFFDPAMQLALADFNQVNASVKHMIIISDGDPTPPRASTIAAYQNAKIKISTVAIGTHGPPGSTPLQNIATATGGRYYVVTNPAALPRIYQREARRVARPLVKDLPDVSPQRVYPHEILLGIDGTLPPLKGMVLTTVKEDPLVEVSLISPDPPTRENATVLASWRYKLGRTAVLTTDAGHRWASAWTDWENYDKFFSQLVRWTMRPINDENKFTVATDVADGKVRVIITALDQDDEFLNFLDISGSGVSPDLQPFSFRVSQVAPGRYIGEFAADEPGSYFMTVSPGPGQAPILTGVDVPYSSEYRDRETNLALLRSLASLRPQGGEAGEVVAGDIAPEEMDRLLRFNTFRHNLAKAVSSQDVWPLMLLIAASIFFADVFVRRVAIGYEWIAPVVQWVQQRIFKRSAEGETDERLERLRSRKAAIASSIDERRAATRFEPQPDQSRSLDAVLDEVRGERPGAAPPAARPQMTEAQREEESYTSRLLKAKRGAWDNQRRGGEDQSEKPK